MKTLTIYWKHLLSLSRMSRRRQTVARPSLCYVVNEDDYGDVVVVDGDGDCSSEIDCCDLDEINSSNMAPFYRCYYCYMTMMVAEIRMDSYWLWWLLFLCRLTAVVVE